MDRNINQTIVSTGFVASLAIVGLFSHLGQDGLGKELNVMDGSLQEQYEGGFKSANPLNSSAIALLGAVKYTVFGQASTGAIVGKNGWLFTTEELETGADFNANIDMSVDRIESVKAILADQGIRLVPVIIPDKSEVYEENLGVERPKRVALRRSTIVESLRNRGIDALDVAPILISQKTQGDVFLRDDTHWSPFGSRIVAQAIAAELIGVPLAPAKVETEARGQKAFDGDLLSFVPTGKLRPLVGPDQNSIAQFETNVSTGASLFGDVDVDVALVGTSFSAKPEWHFAGFLKQALQTDVVNFADEGQGPFAPMDAFLVSETFKNTPPKIVVWEIPVRYTSKDQIK